MIINYLKVAFRNLVRHRRSKLQVTTRCAREMRVCALAAIAGHILKAVRTNPAVTLRYE